MPIFEKSLRDRFGDICCFFFRCLLSLRYRVEVRGKRELYRQKSATLFLSNHPALIDPAILFSWLWPETRVRPVVMEVIYRVAFLRPLMKLVHPLVIPSFSGGANLVKVKKANEAPHKVAEGLRKGENFIIAPVGHLKGSGKELLGGASLVHNVLRECPDIDVVLIRTTGLWGSSFSRAYLGHSPDLAQVLVQGVKTIFKNLLFFAPRRKVIIELERNPAEFPRGATRLEFNRYLEKWYNRYPGEQGNILDSEPFKPIPYSIWSKKVLEVVKAGEKIKTENVPISEGTRRNLYQELRRILNTPSLQINPDMSLTFDLGMDSLDIADLISHLLKNYDVENISPDSLETVQNVLEIAEGARIIRSSKAAHLHWPEEIDRPNSAAPTGQTIPQALLNICERMGAFVACGDDLVGILSYKKLKRAVLVLSLYFRTIHEDRVAVMMPASVGAYIAILALQFAGKVPVMLNWTLGPRYLEETMKLSGAKRVITSWRFVDRLSHVDFSGLSDKMQFLEDIRKNLSLKMKLRGALLTRQRASTVLNALNLNNIDPNNPSVIFFTSGTESTPKIVPLSHSNILSCIKSAFQELEETTPADSIYSILPPFHVAGFIPTTLMPLFMGMKMAFYPDPTDSPSLAEGIGRWKITFFGATPSFIVKLFNVARNDQLASIRLFIMGSEKTPKEVFNRIEKLGKEVKFMECYGMTECAALISLSPPTRIPRGVGRLLSVYKLCTIHPETEEILPEGVEGEICVRGAPVFKGYLNDTRSPFIEIRGESWYRTGDLGYLEKDGTLFFSGRLKRFTKLAGEMISLGAIEETLVKELLDQGQISPGIPSFAVCADERIEGKPQLVLFTTTPIEKETANEILRKSGFSYLIKISYVKKIDQIPTLATGKMDYRRLQIFLIDG